MISATYRRATVAEARAILLYVRVAFANSYYKIRTYRRKRLSVIRI